MGVHTTPNQKVNTVFDELSDVLFWNVEQTEFVFRRVIHHFAISVADEFTLSIVPSNDILLTRGAFFMLP